MATPSTDITTTPAFENDLSLTDKILGVQDDTLGAVTLQNIVDLTQTTPPASNVQTGTTYTLQASDNDKSLIFTNASDIDLILPEQATLELPVGFNCLVKARGTGAVNLITEGSDTIQGNTKTGVSNESPLGIVLSEIDSGVATWDSFGGTA